METNSEKLTDGERPPVFLVDGAEFEDTTLINGGRAFACVPNKRTVFYTNGATTGSAYLPKPLEDLTEGELLDLPGEGLPSCLPLEALQRLKEIISK